MQKTIQFQYTGNKVISIQCDICKKEYSNEDWKDEFEIQEFLFIKFIGGYASSFGDGIEVECDICQHCLYEMISEYARMIDKDI